MSILIVSASLAVSGCDKFAATFDLVKDSDVQTQVGVARVGLNTYLDGVLDYSDYPICGSEEAKASEGLCTDLSLLRKLTNAGHTMDEILDGAEELVADGKLNDATESLDKFTTALAAAKKLLVEAFK